MSYLSYGCAALCKKQCLWFTAMSYIKQFQAWIISSTAEVGFRVNYTHDPELILLQECSVHLSSLLQNRII